MEVARGHSESSLVRGNSLVRGFVFRGSTVVCSGKIMMKEGNSSLKIMIISLTVHFMIMFGLK